MNIIRGHPEGLLDVLKYKINFSLSCLITIGNFMVSQKEHHLTSNTIAVTEFGLAFIVKLLPAISAKLSLLLIAFL